MSNEDQTTPTRPDIDALRVFTPEGTSAVCFNAAYLIELVAYIDALEMAAGMSRDYSLKPRIATPYLIVQVIEDHPVRGLRCKCGVPIGDSVDHRWHLGNQITNALERAGRVTR